MIHTQPVALWFGYESLFSHEQMWIGITGVALVYCVWNFFLRFPKDPPGSIGDGTPPAALPGAPKSSGDAPSSTPPGP